MRRRGLLLFCLLAFPLFSSSAAHAKYRTYTATRYPVILVPGLFGFDTVFGVYGYWYGLVKPLQASGAQIFLAQVTAAQATEVRGEQLLLQIKKIMAITGAKKVNLIGHSHGGLTARYVAGVAPHLVASVTTVASPHQGAALANYLIRKPHDKAYWRRWLIAFGNALANVIQGSGSTCGINDFDAALHALSSAGLRKFNARFPAGLPTQPCGQGVPVAHDQRLYSWTGTGAWTNALDPSDGYLAAASLLYGGVANDGLVGRCSAHFGTVIGDGFAQNHLDVINQAVGLVSPRTAPPIAIFRAHLNRLANAGL